MILNASSRQGSCAQFGRRSVARCGETSSQEPGVSCLTWGIATFFYVDIILYHKSVCVLERDGHGRRSGQRSIGTEYHPGQGRPVRLVRYGFWGGSSERVRLFCSCRRKMPRRSGTRHSKGRGLGRGGRKAQRKTSGPRVMPTSHASIMQMISSGMETLKKSPEVT